MEHPNKIEHKSENVTQMNEKNEKLSKDGFQNGAFSKEEI